MSVFIAGSQCPNTTSEVRRGWLLAFLSSLLLSFVFHQLSAPLRESLRFFWKRNEQVRTCGREPQGPLRASVSTLCIARNVKTQLSNTRKLLLLSLNSSEPCGHRTLNYCSQCLPSAMWPLGVPLKRELNNILNPGTLVLATWLAWPMGYLWIWHEKKL